MHTILNESPIPHSSVFESMLDGSEWMLYTCSYGRLCTIALFLKRSEGMSSGSFLMGVDFYAMYFQKIIPLFAHAVSTIAIRMSFFAQHKIIRFLRIMNTRGSKRCIEDKHSFRRCFDMSFVSVIWPIVLFCKWSIGISRRSTVRFLSSFWSLKDSTILDMSLLYRVPHFIEYCLCDSKNTFLDSSFYELISKSTNGGFIGYIICFPYTKKSLKRSTIPYLIFYFRIWEIVHTLKEEYLQEENNICTWSSDSSYCIFSSLPYLLFEDIPRNNLMYPSKIIACPCTSECFLKIIQKALLLFMGRWRQRHITKRKWIVFLLRAFYPFSDFCKVGWVNFAEVSTISFSMSWKVKSIQNQCELLPILTIHKHVEHILKDGK